MADVITPVAHIIALSQRSDGTDIAEADWRGQHYQATTARGATMALARLLVSDGAPDDAWRATRAGRVVLTGGSLHRLARLTIELGEHGERFRRWKPRPEMEVAEPLQDAPARWEGTGKISSRRVGRASKQGVETARRWRRDRSGRTRQGGSDARRAQCGQWRRGRGVPIAGRGIEGRRGRRSDHPEGGWQRHPRLRSSARRRRHNRPGQP